MPDPIPAALTFGSLFAGAGGMDLGLEAAGLRCVWQVEIDRTASSVLARHWPDVERFEDVRTVGKHNLRPVDVIVGGFPCQGLSVAGQRKGLDDDRSGLFYELARIVGELRPRVLVWENVAGLLSSDGGRDIRRVCSRLAELDYFGAVRTLDAEGFGVAQHRRRVFGAFAPGGVGVGRGAEILALAASVSRDTPAGGKAGTDVAGTLGGGTPGRGWSDDLERCGAFIPDKSPCLSPGQHPGGFNGQDVSSLIVFAPETANALTAANGHHGHSSPRGDGTDNLLAYSPETAATLTAGVSRPGVPVPGRRREDGSNLIAFGGNNTRGERGVCSALSAKGGTGRQDFETETFIVNSATSEAKESHARRVDVARSLDTTGGFASGQGGTVVVGRVAPCLRGNNPFNNSDPGQEARMFITTRAGGRRMTPRECERVMGWPDDHTRYRADGTEIADGPRYRMIGNGVVAPVAEWIGRRLLTALENR